jgi:N-ethylmaleimide reductase
MEMVTPRALGIAEIPGIVSDFAQAALNAVEAGFDGVEIHGANGYLPDQFLNYSTNKRDDVYGGTIEKRARFLFEVVEAVSAAIGSQRTGLRLSPSGIKFEAFDPDPVGLFSYVINGLNDYNLAYLHLTEPSLSVDEHPQYLKKVAPYYRNIYKGVLISCGGYTPEKARKTVEEGIADIIAFGQLYIANPDLVERIRAGAPLNVPDNTTYYDGDERGYTDYPFLRD